VLNSSGFGFGLIYVPAIVSVGFYFEKYRSIAMGIAVCGSGAGTFVLSPFNRILVENYGWRGAFLIKAGIILNCCICGAVLRPLSIEPAEILKKEKKAKKAARKRSMTAMPDNKAPSIIITSDKNEVSSLDDNLDSIGMKKSSLSKNTNSKKKKSLEELPSQRSDRLDIGEKALLAVSMPVINNNESKENSYNDSAINKNIYTSLEVLAHMKSSQDLSTIKSHENLKTNAQLHKKSKIGQYVDLEIFFNIVFIIFAISNFLTSLGFNAPFIYIVDQALSLKISPEKADWLLSTIGISNTVGRVVLGLISNMKGMNRLYLYSIVITVCGIATMVEPFLKGFMGLLIYASVFGFTSGEFIYLY
jgi:MFS transporter, MCT family, solute carrier family 16 (monocarboxylic acid transporters), member 14